MKSFKTIISEVAQPKPEEEKKFKDQHKVEVIPHPHAGDEVFKGTKADKPKAKRKADQEGDANYDMAYESVEQLDELSPKTLKSYQKKADKDAAKSFNKAGDIEDKEDEKGRDVWSGNNKASQKHSALMHRGEKRSAGAELARKKLIAKGHKSPKMSYEEVEQIDEISSDLKSRYAKKAQSSLKRATTYKTKAQDDAAKASKNIDRGYSGDRSVNIDKQYNRLDKADAKAAKHDKTIAKRTAGLKRANEEVEQLDELSPNTLHSYIKKAAGNMAGNAAVAAAQASSSMKKSSPDVKRKIVNRMKGITGASGRLADKANMAENWQEEIPMMQRQLDFIAYAADEISDYLDMAGDPEEWFQNKLAGIHQSMLSMYAYAQGGKVGGNGFDEEVDLEEALKGGQKKLDHNKNGKIDAHDFHLMRKKKMAEEAEQLDEIGDTPAGKKKLKNLIVNRTQKAVDAGASLERRPEKAAQYDKAQKRHMKTIGRAAERLAKEEVEQIDEVSQKTLWNYHAKAGADLQKKREKLDKGTLTMKDLKKGQNRVKGLNRAADKMHEEVEQLDEAFKQGIVKLKDGSSVTLNKEDAGLLNQMFKDLSANNRKKMQEVAMKDKAGFEEILGFAREAL